MSETSRFFAEGGVQVSAYHAAAAIASNYTVVLVAAAVELLGEVGIGREQATEAMVALVDGTLANVRERGVEAALTGPIRRGDRVTVERHLAALADRPELDALYRALARRAVDLARRAPDPAPSDALDAIEAVVGSPRVGESSVDPAGVRARRAR